MTSEFFLIVMHQQSQKPLSALRLNARSAIIGRSPKVDICLLDKSVSRRHAHLELIQSGVVIQDLGSRNGTFVQERRIQTVTVKPGQRIRFGSVSMLLSQQLEVGSEDETTDPRSIKSTPESQTLSPIPDSLSPAQRRVLELLLQGLLERDVARKLGISQHTVHNHAREIYTAYRVHSRAQLLLRAIAIVDRQTDNG